MLHHISSKSDQRILWFELQMRLQAQLQPGHRRLVLAMQYLTIRASHWEWVCLHSPLLPFVPTLFICTFIRVWTIFYTHSSPLLQNTTLNALDWNVLSPRPYSFVSPDIPNHFTVNEVNDWAVTAKLGHVGQNVLEDFAEIEAVNDSTLRQPGKKLCRRCCL